MLIGLLAACQTFSGPDIQATLQAGDGIYEAQAVAMVETSIVRSTQAAGTVIAAETTVAEINSVNQQLFATLAAGSTPTPPVVEAQAPPSNSAAGVPRDEAVPGDAMTEFQPDSRFFLKTGVAQQVLDDGCTGPTQTAFDRSEVTQLYATMRVFNISSGTPLRAEWYWNDELIVADDWIVPWNRDEVCLWFLIDREDTDFPAGSWAVQLYADGFELNEPMTFFIEE